MTQNEFSRWSLQFQKALNILRLKDYGLAEDLRQNTKIDIIKRTVQYTGQNKNIAAGYLPVLPKAKRKNI